MGESDQLDCATEADPASQSEASTELRTTPAAEAAVIEATESSTPQENGEILMPFDLPERKCQTEHATLAFGTLCCACKAVDFDALLAPATRDITGELRPGVQLGTLPQLRSCSSHCPLCKFIVEQVPLVLGPEAVQRKAPSYKENYDDKDLHKPDDHWKYTTRNPEPDEVVVSLRPFRADMERIQDLPKMNWEQYLTQPCAAWLQIIVHGGGKGFRDPEQGMAITCDAQLVPYIEGFNKQPLAGRVVAPQIRCSELRWHLDQCLDNHEECYLHEFTCSAVEEHFWVIDTVRRIIVPAKKSMEYAALSYVWGGARADYTHFQKLASRNAGIWSTINKLVAGNGTPGARLPENLPATISDAIAFCRGIGVRFLWVDSICIDQQSHEMKEYLIPKMDSIYMRAMVTIIAAAGDDANAGLPGVRRDTRSDTRDIIDIQGHKFVTACTPAKELIASTTWWKRAWTYQEGWLSPRCFIFTSHEVLFCCTRCTTRESLHAHSADVQNGLAAQLWMTRDIGFPTGIAQIRDEDRVSSLFTGIMRLYSTRKLSFAADRIKAVQGCLNIITQHCEISCWHGMPLQFNAIGGALMWRHMQASSRTHPQFPSYAWASWDGEPVYFREINVFDPDFADIQEIDWPETMSGLPGMEAGCPALSVTGPVAELYIRPFEGDEWVLDSEKHANVAPGEFGKCFPGELSSEEYERVRWGPSEFLGIVRGVHWFSRQVLVVALMIERREGYVVRRTIVCLPMVEWAKAKHKVETVILL
ncbi:HET-domain-containing protein [Pyrenochaeta sp. DS3sAY3a]|nr:HET-domain-containing protein [Pyrenochaeta sp. DS3sAY3a]